MLSEGYLVSATALCMENRSIFIRSHQDQGAPPNPSQLRLFLLSMAPLSEPDNAASPTVRRLSMFVKLPPKMALQADATL